MATRRWTIGMASFAVLSVITLVAALLWPSPKSGADEPPGSTTTTTTTTVVEGKCSKSDTVSAVLVAAGFTPDQFTVGEESFDLSLPAALEAGNGRFADKPLTSRDAYVAFLASGDQAAEKLLGATSLLTGGSREQLLNVDNWEGFQLLVPSEWSGNTLFVNGEIKPAGTRHSKAGDIGWVFVNPDDCSANTREIRVAVVRMGCSNPQLVPPNPVGMPAPPAQPLIPPIGGPPDTPPTTGLTPKDPSRDVLLNPEVPDQVKGPGTTPVGVDPGPATAPVDSPSGCQGPCPTAPPPPPPAPGVTVPVSNGGNTGVAPPPTVAPPPAPPVTESPTVTVPSP